ncbi:MAG: hypothetical protein RLZZ490_2442 [Cyanobacteriota bacterium]|jgi:UPF0176 protein
MTYQVTTFYRFTAVEDLTQKQRDWLNFCQTQGIKGTILLAMEGINATIAGQSQVVEAVVSRIQQDLGINGLTRRDAWVEKMPFQRMKVKIKPEIVTLGLPAINPTDQVGTYVDPQQWNELLTDPSVTVIDTRNDYEVAIGTFQGAINPHTKRFRDFPDYVQRHLDPQQTPRVAMFCTGGIRCEKATAYLRQQGFTDVYHLQGGILHYLETIPPETSLWEGECFVFDERVAVQNGLDVGSHFLCQGCGYPLSPADQACPHCAGGIVPERQSLSRVGIGDRHV